MQQEHDWLEVAIIFRAYISEYPHKIWPYINLNGTNVPTHFRILTFLLICYAGGRVLPVWQHGFSSNLSQLQGFIEASFRTQKTRVISTEPWLDPFANCELVITRGYINHIQISSIDYPYTNHISTINNYQYNITRRSPTSCTTFGSDGKPIKWIRSLPQQNAIIWKPIY